MMLENNNKMKVVLYAGFKDNAVFYSNVSPPLGLFRLKNYLEEEHNGRLVHGRTSRMGS